MFIVSRERSVNRTCKWGPREGGRWGVPDEVVVNVLFAEFNDGVAVDHGVSEKTVYSCARFLGSVVCKSGCNASVK